MSDQHLQSALREWRTLMTKPATAVILVAIATLLAILAPFETGLRLALPARFAYWLVTVACTFSAAALVNTWVRRRLPAGFTMPARTAVLAVATPCAITPVITLINLITFGYWPSLAEWSVLLAEFAAIALITTVIFQALSGQTQQDTDSAELPVLLTRLPLEIRGRIIALSSEDHYTRVRTTLGEDLMLIRLADAISESVPTQGLRVHRSHWIATTQVTSATRKGDGAVLCMTKGDDIPVSRSHMTAIRDADLLPR